MLFLAVVGRVKKAVQLSERLWSLLAGDTGERDIVYTTIMGKPETFKEDTVSPSCGRQSGAQVKIRYCTAFQKFRYSGEGRPGLKHQDKDFLQIDLYNMSGKQVRVQILCCNADLDGQIHPNGLAGKDCDQGVYSKTYYISKTVHEISIPYLKVERIKTRKTKKMDGPTVASVLEKRAMCLPSPYKERCLQQSTVKGSYDTKRVCLGVIVTIIGSMSAPLFCLSNVLEDASEKTQLMVKKLSTSFVSAQHGGEVDVFTDEPGPILTKDNCMLKVTVDGENPWTSGDLHPTKIYYNRIVTCPVPAYAPNPGTKESVHATLHLSCTRCGQSISCPFTYEPSPNGHQKNKNSHTAEGVARKRPQTFDSEGVLSGSVKLRVTDAMLSTRHPEVRHVGSLRTSGGQLEGKQMARVVETCPEKVVDINAMQRALQTDESLDVLAGRPRTIPFQLDMPDLMQTPPFSAQSTALSTSLQHRAPGTNSLQLVDDSAALSTNKTPSILSAVNVERVCTSSTSRNITSSWAANMEAPMTSTPEDVSIVRAGQCATESFSLQDSINENVLVSYDGSISTTAMSSANLPSMPSTVLNSLLAKVSDPSGHLQSSRLLSMIDMDGEGQVGFEGVGGEV